MLSFVLAFLFGCSLFLCCSSLDLFLRFRDEDLSVDDDDDDELYEELLDDDDDELVRLDELLLE